MTLETIKKSNQIAIAAIALTFAVGCGKSSDEVRNDIDREAQQLAIDDQWQSPCENASLDVFGVSSQVVRYDIGASIEKRTVLFKEDGCTVPSIEVSETGSYDVGSKTPTESFLFDINYTNVNVKPVDDAGRDLLNAIQACGINDWATGQAREVTQATSDNPVLARCWTKTPRAVYDIVRVSGDDMQLGKDASDKPENRPTELETTRTFKRQ